MLLGMLVPPDLSVVGSLAKTGAAELSGWPSSRA
jgi:hypothetical protein